MQEEKTTCLGLPEQQRGQACSHTKKETIPKPIGEKGCLQDEPNEAGVSGSSSPGLVNISKVVMPNARNHQTREKKAARQLVILAGCRPAPGRRGSPLPVVHRHDADLRDLLQAAGECRGVAWATLLGEGVQS